MIDLFCPNYTFSNPSILFQAYRAATLCLTGVQVLKESEYSTLSMPSDDWTIGRLPKEATAQIQVRDLAAQDLAVTVPSWPALRHVRLQPDGNLTLKFEDAATSAATLESFELFGDRCDRSPGLKRFQKELSALVGCPQPGSLFIAALWDVHCAVVAQDGPVCATQSSVSAVCVCMESLQRRQLSLSCSISDPYMEGHFCLSMVVILECLP